MIRQTHYLDAMGITRWQLRENAHGLVILCDDPHQVRAHPLTLNILFAIGLDLEEVQFVDQLQIGQSLIWDLRKHNRPHKKGIIYSLPLNELEQSADAKKDLWESMMLYQQAAQAPQAAHS